MNDNLSFNIDKMPRDEAEQFMQEFGYNMKPIPYMSLMAKDDLANFSYNMGIDIEQVNYIRHNLGIISDAIDGGYKVAFDSIQLRRFRELLREVADHLEVIDDIS